MSQPAVPTSTQPATEPELCACGHRMDQHDRISERFCEATVAGVLRRDCICAGAKAPRGPAST